MRRLEYAQVIAEIEALGIMPERAPSLEIMQSALKKLFPTPSDQYIWRPEKTVVVAGTNGKGSVCATLETLFLAAGETVGLYTSPHLEETTERIRINGAQLSKEQFCQIYSEVKSRTSGTRLSHFETLTLMAAWAFFSGTTHPPVDRAIFEVGLGGKWDATNAIPHQHCIITQLGFDHQNLLGDSIEEIAANKFGIISPGATVIHSPLPTTVEQLAAQVRNNTQSSWRKAVPFSTRVEQRGQNPIFFITTPWGEAQLALPGQRGAENTATALTFFNDCGYQPSLYLSQLQRVKWGGRMEKITTPASPCPIYLSGDHNADGILSLTKLLPYYSRKNIYILVGIGKDKDRDSILSPLFEISDASIILTQTPFKPLLIKEYDQWLALSHSHQANPIEAIQNIFSIATDEDLILVTGSLYLVGLIKNKLLATCVNESIQI